MIRGIVMFKSIHFPRKAVSSASVGALVLASCVVSVAVATSAAATPGPIAQRATNQMTADALPTEQIDNGVVWASTVGSGIAYEGGSFSNVRPPGASAGTNLTPRGNLVAVNLASGALVTSFAPSLNGQVKAVALSPDGSTLYVGGAFTTAGVVGGTQVSRGHIAAYSTSTGALITSFSASVNSGVNAIVATSSTVYVGGVFTAANGNTRTRLAAFTAAKGTLTGWAPTADNDVDALVMAPDNSRVIVGGAFANINGAQARGSAALDASTGASVAWAINQTVYSYNSTYGGAILSLSTDGNAIFGTAWTYGSPSNFEGTFSADPYTGAINWLEDCHGDTYDSFPTDGAVYVVSHEHFCSNVGAFPDTNPRVWHRTTAFTANATGTLTSNQEPGNGYGDFGGQPSPSQINWYPDLPAGTFTTQDQAAWTVSGNSQYLIEGGEFPSVNGVAQYGLTRFAISSLAPNKRGPQILGTSASAMPTALVTSRSTVKIAWQANWDQDDSNLTYSVYRYDKSTTVPIYQTVAASQFWNLPVMGFVDSGLQPGVSYKYFLKVTDPSGNAQRSNDFTVTIPTNYSLSTYAQDVQSLSPTHYWRLDESAGTTTSSDWAGYNNLLEGSTVTNGASGAIAGDSDTAATFDGSATGVAGTQAVEAGPNTFSVGSWFKTTTGAGGKIVGFGNSQSGTSNNYDRQIYMDNAGHIIFGVFNNGAYTVTSSGTYNDGQWHQVVGSMSPAGMVLYIDGKKVGVNGGTTQGQAYNGYWRVGGDNLGGWPSQPTSNNFAGSIDEVAVYPSALTLTQVQTQFTDSGRSLGNAPAPTDSYGKAVYASSPDLYYRLDDASGPTAVDTSVNNVPGVYSGGVTYQSPSPVTGATGTGVTFDGSSGTLASSASYSNPTTYSEELWFNASSQSHGKLIGFGDAQSGSSNNYDRQIYLTDDGHLIFGTYTGQTNVVTSPGTYNDGKWHQVVATQSADGMNLYVDGQLIGTNPNTGAQSYTGYWRIGGDNLNGWPSQPSSSYFNGAIDEVSVYLSELTPAQISAHYAASPVAPKAGPKASFAQSCANLSCAFDASGSAAGSAPITGYSWDFGDGTTGTGVSPTHAFTTGGTYVVALTVTDGSGAQSSTTAQVSVTAPANQLPNASFTQSCSYLSCSFDATTSSDPDGSVASYAWDFGDGVQSTGVKPSHTFAAGGTYAVQLTVTDNQGGTNQKTSSVTVVANQPPVAAASKSCTNLACSFDGTASTDTDGTIASYSWDLGDGSTATVAKPSHTYAAAGTYNVKLTVTDDQGAMGSTSLSVTVTAPANQSPTASFTKTCSYLSCSFDATNSSDPDGTVASYAWDFGDGVKGTGVKPSHTFAAGGTYAVQLTVTDNQGAVGTTQVSVTVAPNAAPTASFTRSCTGLVCTFDGSGSSDSDGTVASYAWSFGDGSSGTGAKPSHTFTASGTYQVTLTVKDDQGSSGSVTVPVTVTGTTVYASDAFARTVSNGWGTADAGGNWTVSGSASAYSVVGGAGKEKMASAGSGPVAWLNSVSATNINELVDATTDSQGTGNGISLVYIARHTSTSDYRLKIRLLPGGVVHLTLSRVVSGTETTLKEIVVPGLTYNTGDVLRARFTLSGTGTTALTASVWKVGSSEPATPQISLSDSTSSLQGPGSLGIYSYQPSNATNSPVTATYDNLNVVSG